jgi:2-succinyl-5-enolpyruvyl-6-hydroxy-3-cyclohexene-1-carboxylate synthase
MVSKAKSRMTNSPAQIFAANLLAQLVANGVDHIFLAPGSRSQALAIAAGQLAAEGHVQLHVRLDERSLAFNALGVGLVSGFPAAVITTSGSAVANLHPAVLEANHAGVPMILLTADRPAELRGVGSNQTTNQVGIFADAVRECVDVPAPEESDSPETLADAARVFALNAIADSINQAGPVQLNLAFREPLSSAEPKSSSIFAELIAKQLESPAPPTGEILAVVDSEHQHPDPLFSEPSTVIDLRLKTVVVAGDAGDLARWYCTGLPLLAEPSSGVRGLPESVPGYLTVLRNHPGLVDQVEQVLVFGKPTLSREVQALLRRQNIKVYADPGRHGVFNPGHNAQVLGDDVEFVGEPDSAWLKLWQQTGDQELAALPNPMPKRGVTRRQLVEAVYATASEQKPVVLGASRLIRVADVFAPKKNVAVYANRGLAGIDGTIGTATGIALTNPGARVRVLLGDLTLLHDAGSLAIDPKDVQLNVQLVVGNDGGGTIFEGLEVAKSIEPSELERLFKTPQKVNLAQLAAAYGWGYVKVETFDELAPALKSRGRVIVDVQLA